MRLATMLAFVVELVVFNYEKTNSFGICLLIPPCHHLELTFGVRYVYTFTSTSSPTCIGTPSTFTFIQPIRPTIHLISYTMSIGCQLGLATGESLQHHVILLTRAELYDSTADLTLGCHDGYKKKSRVYKW